jgi:hypothetical protein
LARRRLTARFSAATLPRMKTRIAVTLMLAAFATIVFAQAEKIKCKAKDLKRNIEAQQTNNATIKTNTPAKPR